MTLINTEITLIATFRAAPGGPLVDPESVYVLVLDEDGAVVSGATPDTATRVSMGRYKYVWIPDTVGTFTVEITGDFISYTDVAVSETFEITDTPDTTVDPSLGEDVIITFSSGFDPLLVDPEMIALYTDQASNLEIAQLVNKFSLEVQALFPSGEYPAVAFDYIHAAVLCALSRVYDGIGGASNYSGFTLGDLQVMDTSSSSKGTSSRGNIDTWCELAEILRREMRTAKGGIVSARKAGHRFNPVPRRDIHSAERPRRRSRF